MCCVRVRINKCDRKRRGIVGSVVGVGCLVVVVLGVFVSVLEGQKLCRCVKGHTLCLMYSCDMRLYLCRKAIVCMVVVEATLCVLYIVMCSVVFDLEAFRTLHAARCMLRTLYASHAARFALFLP